MYVTCTYAHIYSRTRAQERSHQLLDYIDSLTLGAVGISASLIDSTPGNVVRGSQNYAYVMWYRIHSN